MGGFNTQPPEGGCTIHQFKIAIIHSFNTQPPEGGCIFLRGLGSGFLMFQHTATRRWLPPVALNKRSINWFQHTATRRWLRKRHKAINIFFMFQHTATRRWLQFTTPKMGNCIFGFNTQPPEGGCSLHKKARKISKLNTVFR